MRHTLVLLLLVAAAPLQAATVHFGSGSTTDAQNARAGWESAVGGVFTEDNLDWANQATRTTTLGNSFSPGVGSLTAVNSSSNFGLRQGDYLSLSRGGNSAGSFTWNVAAAALPIYGFGFYGLDNDGGTITVTYNDGSQQSFSKQSAGGGSNRWDFFGISGLTTGIASVAVSSTDPGGVSSWDRFVYSSSNPVPEPTSLALWGLGLAGLAFTRRRA